MKNPTATINIAITVVKTFFLFMTSVLGVSKSWFADNKNRDNIGEVPRKVMGLSPKKYPEDRILHITQKKVLNVFTHSRMTSRGR